MANFSLNRHTSIIILAAMAITAVGVAVDSYIEQRNDLIAQATQKLRAVDDAHATMRKEIELRRYLAGPGSSMTFDAATIESQLLHLMRDWQEQTGVSNPSFQRISLTKEHGFIRLTFQLGATGGMGPVAGLLYRVETSPIVLRVDSAQLRPTGAADSDVGMQLTISALCRPGASKAPESQVAAQDFSGREIAMKNDATYLAGAAAALALIFTVSISAAGDSAATRPAGAQSQSPATAPSDSPATQASAPLLPQEYSFLETHNPFGRGHGGGPGGSQEASLVFKGAVRNGDKTTAFFEDLSTKTVIPLEAGAAIARGRIKSIDLDAVVYAVANDSQRIEAGENLNGVVIPPAPTSQPNAVQSSSVAAPANPQPTPNAAPGAPAGQ